MRRLKSLLGLFALAFAAPANATEQLYTLSGTLTGTEFHWVSCGDWINPDAVCPIPTPFTRGFALFLGLDLNPGPNQWTWGSLFDGYQGTIILSGDTLTGIDVGYGFRICGPIPRAGCISGGGSAPTYSVQRGWVPEPSTWLTALLGFAVLGASLRFNRVRRKRPFRA